MALPLLIFNQICNVLWRYHPEVARFLVNHSLVHEILIESLLDNFGPRIVPEPIFCRRHDMRFNFDGLATAMIGIKVVFKHFYYAIPGRVIPKQAKTEKPRFQIVLEKNLALGFVPPSLTSTAFGIE